MDQILQARTNLHRLDMPRNPGSKGNLTARPNRAIFRHEERPATRHPARAAPSRPPPGSRRTARAGHYPSQPDGG